MKKILVIEDNEKLSRILKIQLEHEGYQVENIENWIWRAKNFEVLLFT